MAECKEIEIYIPPDLNKRLEEEQDMLERYFNRPGQYPILNKNNEPCFEHEVRLNRDRNYKLRVYVNSKYPHWLPDLVVCESPEPMPKWGGSHVTHTWPPKYGFLHICHWHLVAWTRENMIYQVFNKGEEWLEAYEKHLVTKKLPLELEQMELTEEEQVIARRLEQQQQLVQLQQYAAFAMSQLDPNFLMMLVHPWLMSGITGDNLQIFPISSAITDERIRNTHRRLLRGESATQRVNEDLDEIMLAEWSKLRCAIAEYKAVWPTWLLILLKFLSHRQHRLMMESLNVQSIQSS